MRRYNTCHYSILGKPLLVDLIRITYSVNWKKYDERIKWVRNYSWGTIKYREFQVFQVQLNSIFLSFWNPFSSSSLHFHRFSRQYVYENPLLFYRFLFFFYFYFILFLLYILYSFLSFFDSFTNFFSLFNCFQRQQLLLVILSSLLVTAMSLVMKLRYKLIQLLIQVYKYNFSVIQTLYKAIDN